MANNAAKVRDEGMRLPGRDRARLVADLLGSLDDEEEIDASEHEAAWSREIAERLHAVDAGEVQPVPCAEARLRISQDE